MGTLRAERARGKIDLEAWEEAIATALLGAGARLLEGLLAEAGCGRRKPPVLDKKGHPMQSLGVREKTIVTVLGEVKLRRSVFLAQNAQETRVPLDEMLKVEDTPVFSGRAASDGTSRQPHFLRGGERRPGRAWAHPG